MTLEEASYWGAIVAAVLAIPALYFAFRQYGMQAKETADAARAVRARVRRYSAMFLNPAKFVGAYGVKTTAYLPVSKDEEIAQTLISAGDVLIVGRGGIGKSHSAVEQIKRFARSRWYQRWRVLTLDRMSLSHARLVSLSKGNYIIFFDDLNEYIEGADGYNLLEAVDAVRDAAKRLRVVATLRSTGTAMDAVAAATKIFNRFKTIELDDWTDGQRDALIALTGVSLSHWDGTPLSAKQPSDEMEQVYRKLPDSHKQVLYCAKACDTYGLHYCSRNLLQRLAAQAWPSGAEDHFGAAVTALDTAGFLKRADTEVQVYAPYLGFVDSFEHKRIWTAMRSVLHDPSFGNEMFTVGRAAYMNREYNVARELFERYVQAEPTVERGHYRLALTLLRLQQWEGAVTHFRRAIEIQPQFSSALFQLAVAYKRLQRPDLAKGAFLRARAAQVDITAGRLLSYAELMLASNETQEALDLVDASLEKDASVAHGWGIKGQILLKLGQYDAAGEAFKEAVAREPDAFVYFGMGQVERSRGEWALAAEYFQKATDLVPDFAQAYSLLGQSLQQAGRMAQAAAAFKEAVRFGEGAAGHFGLGMIYHSQRQWVQAAEEFQQAVDIDGSLAIGYSYLGTALEHLGRFDEGLRAHKQALEINPKSKHFHYAHAEALAKAGQKQKAIVAYEASLRIDPQFTPALRRLEGLRRPRG